MFNENYKFFLVMYSHDPRENENTIEHIVGFMEPPTVYDTNHALNDAIDSGAVPKGKAVYLSQLPKDEMKKVFFGE